LLPVSLDLPIVKREHFNRWYSTGAYYLALTTSDIPFTIISTLIYISLSYVLTNQPLEEFRVVTFLMIALLTSFTAQGFGLLAGSMFELKVRKVD
jgi:ATP-binding cassette, subfamily G (WHITE), member 1